MFPITSFIESYGYLVVFIGAIFEGESVVLIGGISSYEAYLSFPLVCIIAMLGAIIGDWIFFFLGRYQSEWLLGRFPWIKRLMRRPIGIVESRPRFVSFAMRFMYGFRHVVPFSIGASNIPTPRFMIWNGFGAAVWALTFTSAGYLTGNLLEKVLGNIHKYEFRIIMLAIFMIVLFNIIVRGVRMVLQYKSARE